MDRSKVRPGALPTGLPPGLPNEGGNRPADLRKRALGVGVSIAPTTLAPPASGGLGTLGEEDEGASPRAPQTGAPIPTGVFATPKMRAPVALGSWQAYWDKKIEVRLPGRGGAFNVYLAGSEGPVVMCVHGGGYSGLTWSLVARRLKDKYRVVAPDMRGHGLTTTDADTDFSKETLSEDIIAMWEHLFGSGDGTTSGSSNNSSGSGDSKAAGDTGGAAPAAAGSGAAQHVAGDGAQATAQTVASAAPAAGAAATPATPAASGPPASILVGHSMGGGLAVWAASTKRIKRLEGVVVIDVVEGTALAALPHMMNVLAGRPASFSSLDEAVTWAVRSGMSRNKEAAAVSMPSQLLQKPPAQVPATGQQEQQSGSSGAGAAQTGGGKWVWRTPLELSRPYWEGWYSGLSEAFLQLSCPKALVLAGTDRLDRALTIGQMQGKFQLILMPTAGHAIHEDEPDRAAEHLLGFLRRFRVGEPPLVFPKAPAGVRPVLPVVAGPVYVGTGGAAGGAGPGHAGGSAVAAAKQQ